MVLSVSDLLSCYVPLYHGPVSIRLTVRLCTLVSWSSQYQTYCQVMYPCIMVMSVSDLLSGYVALYHGPVSIRLTVRLCTPASWSCQYQTYCQVMYPCIMVLSVSDLLSGYVPLHHGPVSIRLTVRLCGVPYRYQIRHRSGVHPDIYFCSLQVATTSLLSMLAL